MNSRQEYALFFQLAVGATLAVAVAILSACTSSPTRVVTTTTTEEATLLPPPLREEVIPAAPSERVAWQAGRWSWNGSGYNWIAGHWVDHGDGWVWDEGRWRA